MKKNIIFETRGNVELLSQTRVALFSSKDGPKEIYPLAEETFDRLLRLSLSLAGGWQAPLEKHLLKRAGNSCSANFICYLAKDINAAPVSDWQQAMLDENKLLLISPDIKQPRASVTLVEKRDALLFSQIKKIFFLHISKNGRLEKYFNELSRRRYQLYLLDHPLNAEFVTPDVILICPENVNVLING